MDKSQRDYYPRAGEEGTRDFSGGRGTSGSATEGRDTHPGVGGLWRGVDPVTGDETMPERNNAARYA